MRSPNEITAIPMLLEMLSIENCLVTIDTMGCPKKIAQTILSKGADYLLAVKDNQPTLHEAIQNLYFESEVATFDQHFSSDSEQSNEGHGRFETRRCWVCHDIEALGIDVSAWQDLAAFVVIMSERTIDGKTSTECRFYITRKKKSATYFLKATRDHWHVENKCHWVLDVAFRKDESR